MKKIKRLTAIVLTLVMVLGSIPNMNLNVYAIAESEYALKIIGNNKYMLTGEVSPDSVAIALPYADKYTATVYHNGRPINGSTNFPCYPNLTDVEIGTQTKVVFGPFEQCPDLYYDSQDEEHDHYNLGSLNIDNAEAFYNYINTIDNFDYNIWCMTNSKLFICLKAVIVPTVAVDKNVNHGTVCVNDNEPDAGDEVYLTSIPDPGYVLDTYYVIKDNGTIEDIAEDFIKVPTSFEKHLFVGAKFKKLPTRKLDSFTKKQIDALADKFLLSHEDAENYIASLMFDGTENTFVSDKEFLYDILRDLYIIDDSQIEGKENDLDNCIEKYEMYCNKDLEDKRIKLFALTLAFSILRDLGDTSTYDNSGTSVAYMSDVYNCRDLMKFLFEILDVAVHEDTNNGTFAVGDYIDIFNDNYKNLFNGIIALGTGKTNYTSPIKNMLDCLDLENDRDVPLYENEFKRYSFYMKSLLFSWLGHCDHDPSMDEMTKVFEICDVVEEEVKAWANENKNIDETLEYIYSDDYAEKAFKEYSEVDPEATLKENNIALWKCLTRIICDYQLIGETIIRSGSLEKFKALQNSSILFEDLGKILNKVTNDNKQSVDDFSMMLQIMTEVMPDFLSEFRRIYKIQDIPQEFKNYYNQVRRQLKDDVTPKSSSSKKYSAKDTNDTVEKISGSGKKGSKRTITPVEGKKVGTVTVTDKNGNRVEVTKNEDGTYSFIQPASDVNVEVTYKNREITLNIGSTEASVDGETSNLDVCPIIRNDRTMLPIRFVAENLGAKVEWDEKNPNYVLITKGDIKIEITLGSDIMKVNGKEVKLDSVAFAENDRTYLPVRAVSENLNAIVEWNETRPMEVKIYER